jgi:hypothetical protein
LKKALIHASLKDKDLEIYKKRTTPQCFVVAPLMRMLWLGAEKVEKVGG